MGNNQPKICNLYANGYRIVGLDRRLNDHLKPIMGAPLWVGICSDFNGFSYGHRYR